MLDDDEVGLGQARSAEENADSPAPNDNLATSELRQTFLANATWDE